MKLDFLIYQNVLEIYRINTYRTSMLYLLFNIPVIVGQMYSSVLSSNNVLNCLAVWLINVTVNALAQVSLYTCEGFLELKVDLLNVCAFSATRYC